MAALTLPEGVKVKLALPASGETGSVITWSSSKPEILSDDGKVLKRPAYGESDAVVTMTASVSDGEVTKTKEFQVTVPALAEGEDPSLLLELSFNDNTLTDASIYEREVAAVGKANYTDGEGSNGRAFSFNNTYLDLGKESALTPEKLTVSFWLKPNADITGGQTIAWNKGAYNSDGWYLNLCPGGNTNIALGLSVGPGGGQPYYIQINKNANEFFPKTEWTHVAVTYDSDTKEAHFYRNGIPQKTTVGYALSDTATGVIGTNSNIKVIGSNGEEYKHGDKLNAALDEYCLYNRVLDAEEVIALYDKSGKTFDKQAAAQMELDALAIDTTEPLITEITLPEKGDFGSAITWSANGSEYLSDKGEVLERPAIGSADAGVTLTATASYLNGTPATKDFKVTVKAIQEGENPSLLLDLGFDDENLADKSVYSRKVRNVGDVAYVAGVDDKGKAVSLDGNTYLNLGTGNKLTPEILSLSFWIKPNADITGEQIIAWSKGAYNGDGWYLNVNKDVALGLSVGAGNSQPYFIQVDKKADEFFPKTEWTHILVAYDSDTKEAAVYRNGIPQNTSVKYGLSETSTGVIGPCEGKQKAIGYNGPNYKGAYLKAALDEYRLYDKPLGLEEAIEVYEMSGRSLDKQAVARGDINALNIPETVTGRLILPGKGESGSVITWKTSDSSVIALDGTVTRPEIGQPDKPVTLTATAVFAGGAAAEKPFTVTVKAKTEKKQGGILDCGIENVTLADSYLLNAAQKENDYLLSMTSKKFLYEFYRVSGLTPPTEEGYQGWERSNGTNFRGHTFGHYMSALSQAYVGAKNADEKAALLVQIRDAVEGLKECQDAYAEKKPASAGYVSAFRESILDQVDGSGTSDENVIVPWYNLHKVLAGLIDIYTFVDDKELAEGALDIAEGFGEYVFNRCSKLSDNTAMLRTEYGGMNEALYELYDITGNTHYKAAAEYFDEITLFNSLAANQDVLSGKHANTTIPKLTGALKRYTVMKNNDDYYDALTEQEQAELEKYKTAAVNFWDIVVEHHTYITGGYGVESRCKGACETESDFYEEGDPWGKGNFFRSGKRVYLCDS